MKQVIVSYELFKKLQEIQPIHDTVCGTKVIATHLLPVILDDGQIIHVYAIDPDSLYDFDLALKTFTPDATNTPIHI